MAPSRGYGKPGGIDLRKLFQSRGLRRLALLAVVGGGLWYGWDHIAPVAAGLLNLVSRKGTEVASQVYDDVTQKALTKEQREALERDKLADLAVRAREERERAEAEAAQAAYQKWLDDLAVYASDRNGALVQLDFQEGVAEIPPGTLDPTLPADSWMLTGGELHLQDAVHRFGEKYAEIEPMSSQKIVGAAKQFDLASAKLVFRSEGSRHLLALEGVSWESRKHEDHKIPELRAEKKGLEHELARVNQPDAPFEEKRDAIAKLAVALKIKFPDRPRPPDGTLSMYRQKPHLFRRDMNAYEMAAKRWNAFVLRQTIEVTTGRIEQIDVEVAERLRVEEEKTGALNNEAVKPLREAARRVIVGVYQRPAGAVAQKTLSQE